MQRLSTKIALSLLIFIATLLIWWQFNRYTEQLHIERQQVQIQQLEQNEHKDQLMKPFGPREYIRIHP